MRCASVKTGSYYCSMSDSLNLGVLLFAYGTLQDKAVQMANFGRELQGRPDSLPGYSASLIAIRDPAVVATSGKTHHTIAEHSTNPSDDVPGTVFEITAEELAAADRYEVSEYTRVFVTLKSGARAWAYVRAIVNRLNGYEQEVCGTGGAKSA
jgi:Gamma-glutamyl cyclotransferase, AIG2-like